MKSLAETIAAVAVVVADFETVFEAVQPEAVVACTFVAVHFGNSHWEDCRTVFVMLLLCTRRHEPDNRITEMIKI